MTNQKDKLLIQNGAELALLSPTAMPLASSFLWNQHMMIQMNCRGYATAQFMQPEPAKYAHAPNLEVKTFMQPEQPYYAHHPGRFFYIKDQHSGKCFSAPYEPMREPLDDFRFITGQHRIGWQIVKDNIRVEITLSLPSDRACELWRVTLTNLDSVERQLSLVPYFPVGYMSWMNQSGRYHDDLNSIICESVTPYQKYPDYFKQRDFRDCTYLIADTPPDSWDVRQSAFEGEGGLHAPDGIAQQDLSNSDALYETPTAAMQFNRTLVAGASSSVRLLFGPAKDRSEISRIRDAYFSNNDAFDSAIAKQAEYIADAVGPLSIDTPDRSLNEFVNHWLPRQTFYHGDVNRLSTDPQTRNYLQDNMGMTYIKPKVARAAFLHALSQQHRNGAMPDGILLTADAELKYINQVPHMDHCVWLPVCLSAYLDETGDLDILQQPLGFADTDECNSVSEHIDLAMRWLMQQRDHRGLNYIAQGDWCDPMNMVGYKGKGVSIWLTLATSYACKLWSSITKQQGNDLAAAEFEEYSRQCNEAVNTHGWDGQWYARGITDDGLLFGTAKDEEGRIFLNPQTWAILCGAADHKQQTGAIEAVEEHLETPFGVQMLAPAFTAMREDIGRVTQKHPGSAENGSIYNHAAAFYIYALFQIGDADRAYRLLRQMLPADDQKDLLQRGQLPTFIPNYYRGAFHQFPRTAGRSSQLFNTGTVHWFYRCLIDGLFGVQGNKDGLSISPQLPSDWRSAKLVRRFRGARFDIQIARHGDIDSVTVSVDGYNLSEPLIRDIHAGRSYKVDVMVPA